jgi:hypothetical protein
MLISVNYYSYNIFLNFNVYLRLLVWLRLKYLFFWVSCSCLRLHISIFEWLKCCLLLLHYDLFWVKHDLKIEKVIVLIIHFLHNFIFCCRYVNRNDWNFISLLLKVVLLHYFALCERVVHIQKIYVSLMSSSLCLFVMWILSRCRKPNVFVQP